MKLIFLGYMASGKSTIGKIVAEKLSLPSLDLDHYIEEKEQMSISDIFQNKGEIYFRQAEHRYLKTLLASEEDFVLSLGGGTPCYAGNMNLMGNSDAKTVYLRAGVGTLVGRLEQERENRPLVASLKPDDLAEYVAKHLFERNPYYMEADYQIGIDGKPIDTIIKEVMQLFSQE